MFIEQMHLDYLSVKDIDTCPRLPTYIVNRTKMFETKIVETNKAPIQYPI